MRARAHKDVGSHSDLHTANLIKRKEWNSGGRNSAASGKCSHSLD